MIGMPSIKQNPGRQSLPDFRNFGVMLRILLGVNLLALAVAFVQSPDWAEWMTRYVEMAALVQPLLLAVLGLLAGLRNPLRALPLRLGQASVVALVGGLAFAQQIFWQSLGFGDGGNPLRPVILAAAASVVLLVYFELRARAYSPAQTEARLAALNARIRPHFLFNSLNAVLSLIRARPQQAEAALESLSDLFRAAMRDPGELVSLADEIALGKQYLDLEKLRLGDRLKIEWEVLDVPSDLKVPPLMLQPLLENAVYHGIEPAPEGGTVRIRFARNRDELQIELANPCGADAANSAGNRMALSNIRERLDLYYDLEARLETRQDTLPDGRCEYRVQIFLPCRSRE